MSSRNDQFAASIAEPREDSKGGAATDLPEIGGFALLNMIGDSTVFRTAMRRLGRMAACDAPILIEGETGSGKEVAARAIHYLSKRRNRPFVPVNCGAIPDSLVESELFGHGRGAFTDARDARSGLVAQANGGTLFLDEIDALSLKAQVALLRFLQDQRYRPVGRDKEILSDVRIVTASNKTLQLLAETDRFRTDLLYRINVLQLRLPPLREREEDIERLAEHFLQNFRKRYGEGPQRIDPEALRWMRRQSWPGNVRELENVIHREFLLADGPALRIDGAQAVEDVGTHVERAEPLDFRQAKERAIEIFERRFLTRVLSATHGNVSAAAKLANKERRALGRLLKKHGIDRHRYC